MCAKYKQSEQNNKPKGDEYEVEQFLPTRLWILAIPSLAFIGSYIPIFLFVVSRRTLRLKI